MTTFHVDVERGGAPKDKPLHIDRPTPPELGWPNGAMERCPAGNVRTRTEQSTLELLTVEVHASCFLCMFLIMSGDKFSSRDFLAQVINMYRDLPCLWKTSDPDYHNKNKKNQAYDAMLELFKTKDPSATKTIVLKKINSMRGSFRKELNKVKVSEISGTGDRHIPKLWYYHLLHFLEDQKLGGGGSSDEASTTDPLTSGYDEFQEVTYLKEETFSEPSSPSSEARAPTPPSVLKRPLSRTDHVPEKIAKRVETEEVSPNPYERPKYTAFGEHVAERLRSMTPEMAAITQKLISDAIFYGDTKYLNMTSRIVTDSVAQQYVVTHSAGDISADIRKIVLPNHTP